MRQRVEDLGRIWVLVKEILDNEIFDKSGCMAPHRPKDYLEWWSIKTENERMDILCTIFYGIRSVEDQLYDVLSVAEGSDHLNQIQD